MDEIKTPAIVRFVVTTHTGGDDKDRGNGVGVQIVAPDGRVVLDLDNYGRGLVYRDGDDNAWDRAASSPFDPDQSPKSYFWVQMVGDDGDWVAAFSVDGFTGDGQRVVLLRKTEYKKFRSGQGTSYNWPLTYGSRKGGRRIPTET